MINVEMSTLDPLSYITRSRRRGLLENTLKNNNFFQYKEFHGPLRLRGRSKNIKQLLQNYLLNNTEELFLGARAPLQPGWSEGMSVCMKHFSYVTLQQPHNHLPSPPPYPLRPPLNIFFGESLSKLKKVLFILSDLHFRLYLV